MADSTVEQELPPNPLMPEVKLEAPGPAQSQAENSNPQQLPHELDSVVTKAEIIERHGVTDDVDKSPSKRIKLEHSDAVEERSNGLSKSERQKGIAPIKAELVHIIHPGLSHVSYYALDFSCIRRVAGKIRVLRLRTMIQPKERHMEPKARTVMTTKGTRSEARIRPGHLDPREKR